MSTPFRIAAGWSALCVLAVGAGLVRGDSPPAAAAAPEGSKAVERGLTFLQLDAAKWRKEHQCATCHHGTMTVWAFTEAKSQGYAVAAESLAETVKWTKER